MTFGKGRIVPGSSDHLKDSSIAHENVTAWSAKIR